MNRAIIKFLAIATVSATTLVAAQAPAEAQLSGFKSLDASASGSASGSAQIIHKTGRRGRRGRHVAGAIALGLIGAAVIAGSARASHYDRGYSRHENVCRKWHRWCREGDDRACWKYDDRC